MVHLVQLVLQVRKDHKVHRVLLDHKVLKAI
jgi:hypothetical protein